MSQPMTSWKEIAAFLGRSVRTAQRWEMELALPVRRPQLGEKNVVIAIREDLEDWVVSQSTVSPSPVEQVEELRLELASKETDNEQLRRTVESENASLDRRCELLRDAVRTQALYSNELSLRSGTLHARSVELSRKSRTLRRTEKPV